MSDARARVFFRAAREISMRSVKMRDEEVESCFMISLPADAYRTFSKYADMISRRLITLPRHAPLRWRRHASAAPMLSDTFIPC